MRTLIVLAIATSSLLGGAAPAAAQKRVAQAQQAADADAPALTPVEVLNMLDAYALVQAQNFLALTDSQYGEFVARLKKLQVTRRQNQQARNGLLVELRKLTNPAVQQLDEPAVRERLRQLRDQDAKAAAEMKTAYDALDEVMDLRQQARFRIFEEMIERRKLDLLMRARRNASGRGQ